VVRREENRAATRDAVGAAHRRSEDQPRQGGEHPSHEPLH
jgi:hypothetical protein